MITNMFQMIAFPGTIASFQLVAIYHGGAATILTLNLGVQMFEELKESFFGDKPSLNNLL